MHEATHFTFLRIITVFRIPKNTNDSSYRTTFFKKLLHEVEANRPCLYYYSGHIIIKLVNSAFLDTLIKF